MRWKRRSTRWERFANRPRGVLAYSNAPRSSETEKLMCERWVSTPSSASTRSKCG